MGEAHLVAIGHEDAFAFGLDQAGPDRVGTDRGLEEPHGRLRCRGCVERDRLRLRAQTVESGADEDVEARPLREGLQVGRRLTSGDRASELEGVERVTGRDGAQADERRPRQIEPDPRPEQPVDLVERQFPEIEPGDPFRGDSIERGDRRLPVGRALSGDHADRCVVESSEDEIEDAGRWLIEPGHVIDRDDDGLDRGSLAEHLSDTEGHSEGWRRGRRRDAQERRFQRDALWLREVLELLGRDIPEQVVERREGQAGLDFRGPRDEDSMIRAPWPPRRRVPRGWSCRCLPARRTGARRIDSRSSRGTARSPRVRVRGRRRKGSRPDAVYGV